ncbi:MAG TPA: DUF6443 domain-containing protein [Flavisolibacter sp.]|jgi:RHS repeat-associated protein|nr:DUF6443 domain-containing protein [Flavisolibacter sp.]
MHFTLHQRSLALAFTGLLCFQGAWGQAKPNTAIQVGAPVSTPYQPASYAITSAVNAYHVWEPAARYTDENAIITAPASDVARTSQYTDGWGRLLQTVSRAASPQAKDLVAPVTYEGFGSAQYSFLPYADRAGDGRFKTDPFTAQRQFYQADYKEANGNLMVPGEQFFYTRADLDGSPLNRQKKIVAPGNSWAGSNVGSGTDYTFNNGNDNVPIWTIGFAALTFSASGDEATNIPATAGFYGTAQLAKTVSRDEHNQLVVEYRDRSGQLLLKKVQVAASVPADYSGYTGWLCTFYVYDDFGRLRFIITPKAVEAIQAGWLLAGRTDIIQELCYRYEYDEKGRTLAKKTPGAAWEYFIYDAKNRLVFSQDGNLRAKGQWIATLYDGLDRPVLSGIMTYSGTPDALQAATTVQTSVTGGNTALQTDLVLAAPTSGTREALRSITLEPGFEATGTADFTAQINPGPGGPDGETTILEGVAINRNPLQGAFTALAITYYDSYEFTTKTFNAGYNGFLDAGTSGNAEPLPTQATSRTAGLPTGSKVRVLQDPVNLSANSWLLSVSFYDEEGRLLQTQSDLYGGGAQVRTQRYNFPGAVITSYADLSNPAAVPATVKVKTNFSFDARGRLLEISKTINNDIARKTRIAACRYDELGRLLQKDLGQVRNSDGSYSMAPLQQLNYTYTVNGWLRGINQGYAHPELSAGSAEANRYFGMELSYDWGFDQGRFDGSIAGVRWRSKGDGEQRAYGYAYDGAGRFLAADFNQRFGSVWQKTNPADPSLTVDLGVKMGDGLDYAQAYDANGNIRRMQQWGLKLNASPQIDDLQYSYQAGGSAATNKLLAITDAVNDVNSPLHDFKYDPATKSAADYSFDANGNLLSDGNKKLTSLAYNYLDLPYSLTVQGTKTVSYIYDATGEKLQKKVADNSVSPAVTTVTSYLGDAVYEQQSGSPAQLQWLLHEEGRIRYQPATSHPEGFAYDYFIRDHLENVRMILTDEARQDVYPVATLEGSLTADGQPNAAYREKDFYQIDPVAVVYQSQVPGITAYPNNNGNPPYNNNPNSQPLATSQKLYKLFSASGTGVTGLGITLKVMGGDRIDIFGKSYYYQNHPAGTPYQNLLALQLLNGLLSAPFSSATAKGVTATAADGVTSIHNDVNAFISRPDREVSLKPKAAINWILFDERFAYVSSGFSAVGATGVVKDHGSELSNITVPKNGYLYVYASNQSPVSVYFDNLQVIHTRGPLLEESHYYPYGLKIAGISSRAAGNPLNRYGYQGAFSEEEPETDYNEFALRRYDAQTGRWTGVDPYDQFASPYVGMGGNPVSEVDEDGGFSAPYLVGTTLIGAGIGYFTADKDKWKGAWKGAIVGLIGGLITNDILNIAFDRYSNPDNSNNDWAWNDKRWDNKWDYYNGRGFDAWLGDRLKDLQSNSLHYLDISYRQKYEWINQPDIILKDKLTEVISTKDGVTTLTRKHTTNYSFIKNYAFLGREVIFKLANNAKTDRLSIVRGSRTLFEGNQRNEIGPFKTRTIFNGEPFFKISYEAIRPTTTEIISNKTSQLSEIIVPTQPRIKVEVKIKNTKIKWK